MTHSLISNSNEISILLADEVNYISILILMFLIILVCIHYLLIVLVQIQNFYDSVLKQLILKVLQNVMNLIHVT